MQPRSSTWGLALLVAANVVPLVGVLFLGWSVAHVLLLFWAETAILGLINIVKLVIVGRWAAFFLVPFFTIHYGLFVTVHLVFLLVFSVQDEAQLPGLARALALPALFVVATQAHAFAVKWWPRERLEATVQKQMMAPYGRVVVMHLAILAGGFLFVFLGVPQGALFVLVLLKTALDVQGYQKERRTDPMVA